MSAHLNESISQEAAYTYAGKLHTDVWQKHAAYPDESRRPCTVFFKLVRYYLCVLPETQPLQPKADDNSISVAKWMPIAEALQTMAPIIAKEFEGFFQRKDVHDLIYGA